MAEANTSHTRLEAILVEDKGKEILLDRYSDLKFVDDVTELSCKRCGHVVIYHYVANCGHLFCRNCKRVLSEGKGWKCPQCKEYITSIGEEKADVEERVYGLIVHCLNHKYGCKLTMPLREITKHLQVCEDSKEANLPKLLFINPNDLEAVIGTMVHRMDAMSERMNGLMDTMSESQKQTQADLIQKFNEMEVKQRQHNDTKWSELESRINAIGSDLRLETTRLRNKTDSHTDMIKELNANMSKMEETVKHLTEEIALVKEQTLQSQIATDTKIEKVGDKQREDEERMERWNANLITQTTKSLTQTEDRCNQKLSEMEEKEKQLKQQLEEMTKKLNETDDHIRDVSKEISNRMQDHVTNLLTELQDSHNKALSELDDKWKNILEPLDEKCAQVDVLQNTMDKFKHQLDDLRAKKRSKYEFMARSSPNVNEVYNIRQSQSMQSLLEDPKKSKKSRNVTNLRLNETKIPDQTSVHTPNESSKRTSPKIPECNVLLLGENAAEITTFINSFEMLTKYATLDLAIRMQHDHSFKQLVSTPFQLTDINNEERHFTWDIPETKNKQCQRYEFLINKCLMRFIDSAGYGNTNETGKNEPMSEQTLMMDICSLIMELKSLHAIVFVIKSTEITFTASFLNSIREFLNQLSKWREKNLLFVITDFENTQVNKNRVNKGVEQLLKNITPRGEVKVDFSKNTFFIHNKGLRGVTAHSQGVRPSEAEMVTARMTWQMAAEQCQSLVARVHKLQPLKQELFNSIFKKKALQKTMSGNTRSDHQDT